MPGDESENGLELDGGHDVSILDAAEIEAFLGGGRENDCDALDRDDMEEEEEEEEEEERGRGQRMKPGNKTLDGMLVFFSG